MKTAKVNARDAELFDVVNTSILILILAVVLYPLIFIVSASLSSSNKVLLGEIVLLPKEFSVESYIRVFSDKSILSGFKNTFMYTAVGTSVNVFMSVLAAYPISRKSFAIRNVMMFFITFTMLFSGGLIPSYLVIRSLGLLDNFWVMVLPSALSVGNIIIMRTFFQTTIPNELYEAAYIDGCSNILALTQIVLPLSKAIIAVIGLFYAVGHWNSYFNALIYLKTESKFPLQLVLRSILIKNVLTTDMFADANIMGEQQNYAESIKYSVIIVSSLPVMLIYPFIQKYFVKGVMIGAIKG